MVNMNVHPLYSQLVTHEAVFRWDQSIMDGIYDMLRILMELVAERLKQAPIPVVLLDVLAMVWNISITVL